MKRFIALSLFVCGASLAVAQQVTITPLAEDLYMLQGRGGNVALSLGADGAVMIDDDYPNMINEYQFAVDEITGEDYSAPSYIINTHWHQDHTGGNEYWAGEGATIIAHKNVRARMQTGLNNKALGVIFPPSPEQALPVFTFANALSLYFNDEAIVVEHYSAGHTDGDSIVRFTNANVVHLGDHFFNGRFPFVDIESGGNVTSYTDNIAKILASVDESVQIVPGHGPLASKDDLRAYYRMLQETTQTVRSSLDDGQSVDEIIAAGLGDQWEAWGSGFISEAQWIRTIAESL